MNKKKIMYALSFGILLFAASCENKTGETTTGETIDTVKRTSGITAQMEYTTERDKNKKAVLDSTDFDKTAFILVKERIRILSICVGSYCSNANHYCENDTCLSKIKDCHTIDSVTFNLLTRNGENGHGTFNYENGIGDLLKANCSKYIRLICSGTTYNVDTVATVDTTLANTAHYSIALWQEIAKQPIKSIEIHKAIYDESTKKYLIPFKVHLSDGGVEVYDVSNDYP